MNRLYQAIFVLLLFGQTTVSAQQTVLAAGQSVTGNGSISYSIGQVVYTANAANSISVTQGVQQTYGNAPVSGLEEGGEFHITIYPNPTAEWLVLEFPAVVENSSFQLLDENGKLLQQTPIIDATTSIPMKELASGTYFLKIMNNQTELQTAKIVKSN